MISEEHSLREKKLRGSGGYVFAKVTDEEQKRGNLGGPELFLAGIGRLAEERFLKYFCNKCEKEYEGSPVINYENPNEELGEGVTLVEKGEYKCTTCDNTIAQYRKFNTSSQVTTDLQSASAANTDAMNVSSEDEDQIQESSESNKIESSSYAPSPSIAQESTNTDTAIVDVKKTVSSETEEDILFVPIHSLIGMPAYDTEAMLIGKVREIGLRRPSLASGKTQISIKITKYNSSRNDSTNTSDDNTSAQTTEVLWNDILKIGDIVLLSRGVDLPTKNTTTFASTVNKSDKCSACGYQNEKDAVFCEECGEKL